MASQKIGINKNETHKNNTLKQHSELPFMLHPTRAEMPMPKPSCDSHILQGSGNAAAEKAQAPSQGKQPNCTGGAKRAFLPLTPDFPNFQTHHHTWLCSF